MIRYVSKSSNATTYILLFYFCFKKKLIIHVPFMQNVRIRSVLLKLGEKDQMLLFLFLNS